VEAARRGGTSGEATSVLDSVPASRRRLRRRGRVSGAGIAMGIVGIALIVAALVFGGRELGGTDTGKGGAEIRLPTDATSEFDPAPGDERETGTEQLAVDSNPTGTAWTTEHYDTQDFGGIKDGVGLAVDAGTSVAAKSIEIRSPSSGWSAEIYEAEGSPPSDLDDWGRPLATVNDGGTVESVNLPARSAQSFLIWITQPPEANDDPGRYQMEISDVRLLR
jgi:hypothetical protein